MTSSGAQRKKEGMNSNCEGKTYYELLLEKNKKWEETGKTPESFYEVDKVGPHSVRVVANGISPQFSREDATDLEL